MSASAHPRPESVHTTLGDNAIPSVDKHRQTNPNDVIARRRRFDLRPVLSPVILESKGRRLPSYANEATLERDKEGERSLVGGNVERSDSHGTESKFFFYATHTHIHTIALLQDWLVNRKKSSDSLDPHKRYSHTNASRTNTTSPAVSSSSELNGTAAAAAAPTS